MSEPEALRQQAGTRPAGEIRRPLATEQERGLPALKLGDWLAELRARAGLEGIALDPQSERAILGLARVAAHRSERIAAPISAYLLGIAAATMPEAERGPWLERLVAALEPPE